MQGSMHSPPNCIGSGHWLRAMAPNFIVLNRYDCDRSCRCTIAYASQKVEMPIESPLLLLGLIGIFGLAVYRLFVHPLRAIPGPCFYAVSSWRLLYDDLIGHTSRKVHALHATYGRVIRIGPNHVVFDSLSALKTIYGVGSRSNRTAFYEIFKPYGEHTMFTMSASESHSKRKKFLVRAYAKTGIMKGSIAEMIESKVAQLLDIFDGNCNGAEICHLLYYFTLDVSTAFIFTPPLGTEALKGNQAHRDLLRDLGISKRGHRRSVPGILLTRLLQALNIEQAVSFKHVRAWALGTFDQYIQMRRQGKAHTNEVALVTELYNQREKRAEFVLLDIDLASECADHLGAGVETTRNTMIFLIWAMSLPENKHLQSKIREEVLGLDAASFNDHGLPMVEAANRLTCTHAVIKEALRLYAPLPQLQPRFFDFDMVIDGYFIPARTTVSMAPFTQHRNEEVFQEPYRFDPERWLRQTSVEMQRWWWPFSNGGRACTGIQ
jgi:cytochrome P450